MRTIIVRHTSLYRKVVQFLGPLSITRYATMTRGIATVWGTLLGLRSGHSIEDLTVRRGQMGGGIRVGIHERVEILRVNVESCIAPNMSGGGIYCGQNSEVLISDCDVIGNMANSGAGINSELGSKVRIERTRVLGNRSVNSAAGLSCVGDVVVTDFDD